MKTEPENTSLAISSRVSIPLQEIEFKPIRAQGAGGQNVNKVATALHLRFDIHASSLPQTYKERLLNLKDRRISRDGVIVIKSQQYRTQERNRQAALERLGELVHSVFVYNKPRKPTKPSRAAKVRRLDQKSQRGKVKALRRRPPSADD